MTKAQDDAIRQLARAFDAQVRALFGNDGVLCALTIVIDHGGAACVSGGMGVDEASMAQIFRSVAANFQGN